MRVLIVEDSDDLRELLARGLRHEEFEVCDVDSAEAALDALLVFTPEVVVTDLIMPLLDGINFIFRLRLLPGMARVPVVVMTASSGSNVVERARAAGAEDVLMKPVTVETLANRIRSLRQ